MLSGALPPAEVWGQITGPRLHRKAGCPESHLGAFGQVGQGFEGVLALCRLVTHTAGELCAKSPACWASTSASNRGARMVLDRAGFSVIDEIARRRRRLLVYELTAEERS